MNEGSAPLSGIRVLDLTDGYGAYAGRLLAGLGADVTRVETEEDDQPPLLAPRFETDSGTISLFDEWVNSGKTSVRLDDRTEEGKEQLEGLIKSTDVVLSGSNDRRPGGWASANSRLVHVVITPFGWGLSPDWSPVDDLFVLGAGGLLYLGGYPDTGPIGTFGHQSLIASGIFGAVAALVGLIEREKTGQGSSADVSAQEAIAQALEDSLPAYVLTGEIRGPQGEEAREAGTGVYACADGYVSMVAGRLGTAKAWTALVEWLSAVSGEAVELLEPQWSDFSFRQTVDANDRFREIFENFAGSQTKESLYIEGQRRGIALSPVSNVQDLLDNEQLDARGFFVEPAHQRLGTKVRSPGSPFRLSGSEQIILDGPTDEPVSPGDMRDEAAG